MNSAVESKEVRAVEADVTDDEVIVQLEDGRTITTPLAWYPRLVHASEAERNHFRLVGGGLGIHWPDLDEDVSIAGMPAGLPSGEGPESLKNWLMARPSGGASRV